MKCMEDAHLPVIVAVPIFGRHQLCFYSNWVCFIWEWILMPKWWNFTTCFGKVCNSSGSTGAYHQSRRWTAAWCSFGCGLGKMWYLLGNSRNLANSVNREAKMPYRTSRIRHCLNHIGRAISTICQNNSHIWPWESTVFETKQIFFMHRAVDLCTVSFLKSDSYVITSGSCILNNKQFPNIWDSEIVRDLQARVLSAGLRNFQTLQVIQVLEIHSTWLIGNGELLSILATLYVDVLLLLKQYDPSNSTWNPSFTILIWVPFNLSQLWINYDKFIIVHPCMMKKTLQDVGAGRKVGCYMSTRACIIWACHQLQREGGIRWLGSGRK